MSLRTRLRCLGFGLSTVLGLGRRGYFIPSRSAEDAARYGHGSYAAFEALFAAAEVVFAAHLACIDAYGAQLASLGGRPPAPRWEQDWFPRLDAAAAYAIVRERRPRRIVEVGSGHSTRFLARAIRDEGLACRLVAIDPAPRADLAGLPIERIAAAVQAAGCAPFATLAAGDILLIDSSHILMPGSDVEFLLARVLPSLPAGVLVHVHDVFLPDGYPADWAWRGYNEQGVIAALLAGGGWRPLFASHYVATRMATAVARSAAGALPLPAGARETSLWIEKTAPALSAFAGANLS